MVSMRIDRIETSGFSSNCYLLCSDGEALIVDPSADPDRIDSALKSQNARLAGIVLTHGHFDHLLSLDRIRKREQRRIPVYLHEGDAGFLSDPVRNASGLLGTELRFEAEDVNLRDGDRIPVGKEWVAVRSTPGHTPGSVCLVCGSAGMVTGDTLFAEGYGRYDLPGGDREQLFRSLNGLAALDPETRIEPGHGSSSTLGAALRLIGI
ncbi:MAG: MBL fold metallo-hydrolase [Candidatus Methanomethylophilaceae archaeon]|nr:MBL fold metallo-hydrolase [Candidatus Methanomethylophilaceae archaeon]